MNTETKPKRVNKKKTESQPIQLPLQEPIQVPLQEPKTAKPKPKPRAKKTVAVKEESDDEIETKKIQEMINKNPKLRSEIEDILKKHLN